MRKCRKIIFFQFYLKYRDIKPAAVLVFKYKDIILNVPDVFFNVFHLPGVFPQPSSPQRASAWTRSPSSEFLLSFALTLLYFSFLITHMRCFCWPSSEPTGLVCLLHLAVSSAAEALLSGRNSPRNLANCSHKLFLRRTLFFFFFSLLYFFYFSTPHHHHLLLLVVVFSSSHPRFAARCHGNSLGGDTETDKGIPELKFSAAACLTEQQ